ncbi:MAG: sugar phosphate nucleotidyltransferase [Bacteroidota bacterium]
MKIIVPMAGMGKRMRPHTLVTPKPLLPIAGKPIVQRLVEDIVAVCPEKVDEIAYIIGDFGKETEQQLIDIAETLGAKGSIYYQQEALGTAHAIYCAKDSLQGKVVVAFADTLFRAEFDFDETCDGIVWVNQVEDPKAFGVVKLNDKNQIIAFVEKPDTFVSDLAIIGIYYFKDGENLSQEIKYLLDNNIKDKGEFQLTVALENMMQKGKVILPGKVNEWMDCGNKDATVDTNKRILELTKSKGSLVSKDVIVENSIIIEPCFIGEHVHLVNSVVGPHASIGDHGHIKNSVVSNSIVQTHSKITNAILHNAMLGNHVRITGVANDLSLGDYSTQG